MTLSLIQTGVPETPETAADSQPLTVYPNTAATRNDSAVFRRLREYDDAYCKITITDSKRFHGEINYVILQSCTEAYIDRVSPTYTFGAPMVHSSGTDARQFVYTAFLIPNEREGDYAAKFADEYEFLLRASALIGHDKLSTVPGNLLIELSYRDQIRLGYITSLTAQRDSQLPNAVAITFSMFVVDQLTTSARQA